MSAQIIPFPVSPIAGSAEPRSILRIDAEIRRARAAVVQAVGHTPVTAEAWQAAYDARPDLTRALRRLWLERDYAQIGEAVPAHRLVNG